MTPVQDLIPGNHCYGCGPLNPDGLQIKSYWDGAVSTCTYMPRAEQSAGPTQFLYGGTIASLFDCHCVCTAIANHYELEGRAVGDSDGEDIWCVTGELNVTFLAPTPIDKPVELKATIGETSGRKTIMNCTMHSDDTLTAEAEVIVIRVPNSWRE